MMICYYRMLKTIQKILKTNRLKDIFFNNKVLNNLLTDILNKHIKTQFTKTL